jgi:AcrR family transcriptional regulator
MSCTPDIRGTAAAAELHAPLELKEACIRAARDFIAEHGVEGLSLRDVARSLGVSHQAPYKHYASKDHLLAEVIRRCFEDFATFLDGRRAHAQAHEDLASLGLRYLSYAQTHPLEYRLMFATPWPKALKDLGIERDAAHAFDVLRGVLRRIHGESAAARAKVDSDAMFIWANMHGLATLSHCEVLSHLNLARGVLQHSVAHTMHMMSLAMRADGEAGGASASPGVSATLSS